MISKISSIILLIALTSGCIMVPKVSDNQPNCDLATNNLDLSFQSIDDSGLYDGIGHCRGEECFVYAALPLLISAGSVVISGSLYIFGNTIHWVEKQTRCDDSTYKRSVGLLNFDNREINF